MPITQSLNSKANVKKITSQDLPFSPAQPVINSAYSTSTLGQTVINLGFTVQAAANGSTSASTDIFFLFLDGKKLTLGASNDYTFTSIGSDGTSSQVTLNFSMVANMNIQAYKLGLKPEIQFGMDNRFVQLYAAQNAGFQGFVSQTDAINTATTSTGTPAAGTFYSSIIGRAPMVDISQDLKPRFGIERLTTQLIYPIQTELGPNNEPIYGVQTDLFGQIRFGGTGWSSTQGTYGQDTSTSTVGDFVEITFYGTGLNLLTYPSASARSSSISVDGVSSGTLTQSTATTSAVISSGKYSPNAVVNVVSGLTLGVHTVKLTMANNALDVFGFEILNQNATPANISVNPGIAYNQGQKANLSSQYLGAYNSVVTGTTGGRVATYLTLAGSVGQAFTQNATSPSYLTNASHANEEVARVYNFREFGSGQSTDFSLALSTQAIASYTLDDGTTSLMGTSISTTYFAGQDAFFPSGSGNYFVFTFVGTGLDIFCSNNNTGTQNYTVIVDGVTQSSTFTFPTVSTNVKIASGLPYGSHTVKLIRNGSSPSCAFVRFTVYQPKTPSIPSGAIQLGSYNVMANYSAANVTDSTANGNLMFPSGVLYKSGMREFLYSGANWSLTQTQYMVSGWDPGTLTNNSQPMNYTFFGTGIVVAVPTSVAGTLSYTVAIDGVLNSTGTVLQNTSNGGGGTYSTTSSAAGDLPGRVAFTGLTLGLHTVTITRTAGAGNFYTPEVHVITPIHSHKGNTSDVMNSISIGSNCINDDRQTQPVKGAQTTSKYRGQANGIVSGPSTSSTSAVPMPDMNLSVKSNGSWFELRADAQIRTSSGNGVFIVFMVDGVLQNVMGNSGPAASDDVGYGVTTQVYLSPGYHEIVLCWYAATGTLTNIATYRNITVKEL